MAGKCYCEQGITPLTADDRLPADKEPLLWLAQQSAYIVNSSGIGHANTREALRDKALERGLGRGSLLNPGTLAECIENRFGHDFLNWLEAQTSDKGRPTASPR